MRASTCGSSKNPSGIVDVCWTGGSELVAAAAVMVTGVEYFGVSNCAFDEPASKKSKEKIEASNNCDCLIFLPAGKTEC